MPDRIWLPKNAKMITVHVSLSEKWLYCSSEIHINLNSFHISPKKDHLFKDLWHNRTVRGLYCNCNVNLNI